MKCWPARVLQVCVGHTSASYSYYSTNATHASHTTTEGAYVALYINTGPIHLRLSSVSRVCDLQLSLPRTPNDAPTYSPPLHLTSSEAVRELDGGMYRASSSVSAV